MQQSADSMEDLGRRSENANLQDFASLAAQYRRAFASALPTHTRADSYLYNAAARAGAVIYTACAASGN